MLGKSKLQLQVSKLHSKLNMLCHMSNVINIDILNKTISIKVLSFTMVVHLIVSLLLIGQVHFLFKMANYKVLIGNKLNHAFF